MSPSLLCEGKANGSDPTASTLHTTLLEHASQPYSRMLIRWISTGYLSDPFDEFMVKESTHISKSVLESDYTDEYWERRYTVCHQVTPEGFVLMTATRRIIISSFIG